jgi:phosphate starvation-inducible protein PhoH and related proteins
MADDSLFPPPASFFDVPGAVSESVKASNRKARKAEKEVRQLRRTPKPIEARSVNQTLYMNSINENDLTFGIGPAGVGKTYVAARVFGEWLASGKISKVYVARPNVAKAKHKNGFLPGTLEEKTAPWLVPIFEGLKDAMGATEFERARKEKQIEEVPFEFIQGRTFRSETGSTKGVACIVDEAENLDLDDLYITLTRQGEGLTMVLCGDIFQARISDSGLADVIQMASEDNHEGTGVVVFDENDVVRSRQAAQWVKSFSKRRTKLGFYEVRLSKPNLHSVTECDSSEAANFRDNPPDFLKGAA